MSAVLVYLYIVLNIIICIVYFRKEMGVFQFPFLISCVSLTFIVPQLLDLLSHGYFSLYDNTWQLVHLSLCNVALTIGFNYIKKNQYSLNTVRFENGPQFNNLIYIFFLIGAIATLMNRGAYKGGFVSGTFVIISFFTNYSSIALLLILIGFNRKILYKRVFVIIAITIVLITLDKIIASGRRAATINLVLTVLYFYLDNSNKIYRYLKYGVPAFFLFGMIAGSQIGEYRNIAYEGDKSFIDNLSSLDFTKEKIVTSYVKGEVYNAFEGMRLVEHESDYDLGAYNWNGIVKNFVPTAFVSKDTKQALMFSNSSDTLINYLTRSGSTMTGYFDAYLSFGLFGFIKFLLIGCLMGYFWSRRDQSDISLLFYFVLLTPGLHLLTHSSNYIVSEWFFELIFVYPFLRIATLSDDGYVFTDSQLE